MRISLGALLNLGGHAAPLVAALFTVPLLVAALGPERFGFLALAWALVGYFSLFDLGLGRALARVVAERRRTAAEATLPALCGAALTLTSLLGLAAGVLLYGLSGWICEAVLRLPAAMVGEASAALRILAASLPLVTLAAALRGLMEGARYFGWINAIRVPLGVLTFVAPLAVASAEAPLPAVCAALALVRAAALAAHWAVCTRLLPALAWPRPLRTAALREVVGFGAWVTLSNVIGPLMVYADRFVIGALISVAAVAYYAAPYEVLTRLWVLPAALTAALFPAMAGSSAEQARVLRRKAVLWMLATAVPLALVAAVFAPQWLKLWLGQEYVAQATKAAQWLALGVGVNCLAHIPVTVLQARGEADVVAKLHLAELPFYFGLLWLLIATLGIEGAAIASAGRCTVDALMLFALAERHLRKLATR